MGMDADLEKFIRSLKLPRGFSVCDFGSLMVVGQKPHRPAREFYEELGCGHYDAIDGNGEGTVTADLNEPIGVDLLKCDLVTDLGTGEHIFDQAQLFRSVHNLLKVGGTFVFDRPIQRWEDHGFYNFQPNLIRALCAANDYLLLELREHEFKAGRLAYGAYRKLYDKPFVVPQQGRYTKTLKFEEAS